MEKLRATDHWLNCSSAGGCLRTKELLGYDEAEGRDELAQWRGMIRTGLR